MIGLVIAGLIVAALAPVPHLLGVRSITARRIATLLGVVGVAVAAIAAAASDPVTGVARGLTLVLGVVAAATGAISLVPMLFEIVGDDDDGDDDDGDDDDGDDEDRDDDGRDDDNTAGTTDQTATDDGVPTPLRGGRLIGVLERTAVAVAVLAGWPEGIAVVLAVKGLARYPEIRAAHAGEQFIIGTFGSVLWALAVAGTTHLVLS